GTIVDQGPAYMVLATTLEQDVAETIQIDDITNPANPGVVYVRMLTYVDGTAANQWDSEDPTNGGAVEYLDSGSVSMYFNNDVVVGGSVQEILTFCVSGSAISQNCGDASATAITLGEEQGVGSGVFALVPG